MRLFVQIYTNAHGGKIYISADGFAERQLTKPHFDQDYLQLPGTSFRDILQGTKIFLCLLAFALRSQDQERL